MKQKKSHIIFHSSEIFGIGIILLLIVSVLVWYLPNVLIERYNDYASTNSDGTVNPGTIGDTLGGTMGPLIALIAAALTFLAFWAQYKSNEQQTSQFESQAEDTSIERFENKFYNLINLHRANVEEMKVSNVSTGRKTFVSLYNELKFTYLLAIEHYKSNTLLYPQKQFSEEKIYNIAYLIFFFGIGPNSTKLVVDLLGKSYEGFIQNFEEFLKSNQAGWRQEKKIGKTIAVNTTDGYYSLDIKYKPFCGHASRLSHYFRNVYQTLAFIDSYKSKAVDDDKKQEYATTLRAQLSVHEQVMLYYNALSVLGAPWLDKKDDKEESMIEKYAIVRSIPMPLADFYKSPEKVFTKEINKAGKYLFEWYEIKRRLNP